MMSKSIPGIEQSSAAESTFDWTIYADATLAGLSVLIPIPFLDSITEDFFRNRMVATIARRRNQVLHPQAEAVVNRTKFETWTWLGGCFLWPFRFALDLILRLSRKILYFLTIKKAVDALNYYWRRAYLLDYMIRNGYLSDELSLEQAVLALEQILAEEDRSPMTSLARELLKSPSRLVRAVRQARIGEDSGEVLEIRRTMDGTWDRYEDYLQRLQNRFKHVYETQQLSATA